MEEEKIEEIIKVARSAPSAGGLKAYEIKAIKEDSKKEKLARAALNQSHVKEASVDLVFLQGKEKSEKK